MMSKWQTDLFLRFPQITDFLINCPCSVLPQSLVVEGETGWELPTLSGIVLGRDIKGEKNNDVKYSRILDTENAVVTNTSGKLPAW